MRIEYFASGSADCPLVLLYGRDSEAVEQLLSAALALHLERANQIAVHQLPGMGPVDGIQLSFSRHPYDRGLHQKSQNVFDCQLMPGAWVEVAALLEPFTLRSEPTVFKGSTRAAK